MVFDPAEASELGEGKGQHLYLYVAPRISYALAYSYSMPLVLSSRRSSCAQFSVPSRAECRQVTPRRVSSASRTKVGTTSITFFKLIALSFCPRGAGDRLLRFDSAENARFETQPPFSLQAASYNHKRISAGGFCIGIANGMTYYAKRLREAIEGQTKGSWRAR